MINAERQSPARSVAIVAIALLLAADLARLSVASTFSETGQQLPLKLAPFAPSTLISASMAQVGEAAAKGTDPSTDTLNRLRRLTVAAPLEPDPFLVEAALAERRGAYDRAERLLLQALARAPRSPAAHYLLADVRLRQGKVLESLRELAVLAKILPGASLQLVGGLAEYAKTPGALRGLTGMLAENPQLKGPLLNALAADPSNADLIVQLFPIGPDGPQSETTGWQSRLLDGLVKRGDYDQAYGYWRRFAGLAGAERPLLFNGDFATDPVSLRAPPPFNWILASGGAGVAERDGGRLRVLYYGREEASLARQLLLLSPGVYRFEASTTGGVAPHALAWTLACSTDAKPLMNVEVTASAPASGTFTIPSDCQAQMLQLIGHLQDMPKDSDARIGPVVIARVR